MKTYVVTITQIESRSWTLQAESEEKAIAQAEEWNENPTGSTPEGAIDYGYSYNSDTACEVKR